MIGMHPTILERDGLRLQVGQVVGDYTVVALRPNAPKRPWIVRMKGKDREYIVPTELLRKMLPPSQESASSRRETPRPEPSPAAFLELENLRVAANTPLPQTSRYAYKITGVRNGKWVVERRDSTGKTSTQLWETFLVASALGVEWSDPSGKNEICDPDNPETCFKVGDNFLVGADQYRIVHIKGGKHPIVMSKNGNKNMLAFSFDQVVDMADPNHGKINYEDDPTDPLNSFYDTSPTLIKWKAPTTSMLMAYMSQVAALFPSTACASADACPIADVKNGWAITGGSEFANTGPGCRFVVGVLRFVHSSHGHVNSLVLDRTTMTAVRFEPHGSRPVRDKAVDVQLASLLPSFTYFGPRRFQPEHGPQGRTGVCAVYVLMFVHHYLAVAGGNKNAGDVLPFLERIMDRFFKLKQGNRVSSDQKRYASRIMRI